MGRILSTRSLSIRVLTIVLASIIGLVIYYSIRSYNNYLHTAETHVLRRLETLANTSAKFIDGDTHQALMEKYQAKDTIKENAGDALYQQIHQTINRIAQANDLNTPIYTLVKIKDDGHFEFGVTSASNPYFRHVYDSYPEKLKEKFDEGGKIKAYGDDHGTWLSAFAPIKNRTGEIVAVVQADQKFDDFQHEALMHLYKDMLLSGAIVIVLLFIILRTLRGILRNEDRAKTELEQSYKLIEHKNQSIEDSINYAKRIQDALMPDERAVSDYLPDSYVMFKGKDAVSGDFPWLLSLKDKNETLIATVDCTGHGVPGALLSIIGYFLLNDIINGKKITEPAQILEELHKGVMESLNQQEDGSNSHDGMDIALVKINQETKTVEFAGAHRPLIHISNGELNEIKGERLAIGGTQYLRKNKQVKFTNHVIEYQPGDTIHFFSDGYPDQIGGPENRRFMAKNMKQVLKDNNELPMKDLGKILEESFNVWKGEAKQLDDVLVIGVRLD